MDVWSLYIDCVLLHSLELAVTLEDPQGSYPLLTTHHGRLTAIIRPPYYAGPLMEVFSPFIKLPTWSEQTLGQEW